MTVDRARLSDVPQIHKLVNLFADRDEMLHRPLSELYENVRDYFVIRHEGRLIGCVALHVTWLDLAELKALAVDLEWQGKGLGSKLAAACLEEAREMDIATVYALTYRPGFFARFGFKVVDISQLPRKVWGECYRCPKFPDCDEIAMVHHSGDEGV
ncbi:MAG: N-acetyltransferase [Dehalococcoidia bacterium]|nr:N-acetyltransferase [Dehalococcoidia bacterium]